ncbi:unnamed protein product [Lasius platythorax]|uniref:Uncharacterized protein n=1 Tax=Lasius platythorax TaxID=488582 RepID=A0AAV2MYH1_9HYME
MVRPMDFGTIATFLLSRGLKKDKSLLYTRRRVKQHISNVIFFFRTYMRLNYESRIEEVITLDNRKNDIPREIERLRIFDSACRTYLTRTLLKRCPLVCIANWHRYLFDTIADDVTILREAYKLFRNHLDEDAVNIPHFYISIATRAYFRLMYFAHGINKAYNYQLCRQMFADNTECQSIDREFVCVNTAIDRDIHFPLFASDIPNKMVNAFEFIWEISRMIVTNDPIQWLTIIHESWPYARFTDKTSNVHTQRTIQSVFDDLRHGILPFQLEAFISRCDYLPAGYQVRVTGTVQADVVARNVLLEPRTSIARAARITIDVSRIEDVYAALVDEIHSNWFVVSRSLWDPKCTNIPTFSVVDVGEPRVLPDGQTLTPSLIKRMIKDRRTRIRSQRRSRSLDRFEDRNDKTTERAPARRLRTVEIATEPVEDAPSPTRQTPRRSTRLQNLRSKETETTTTPPRERSSSSSPPAPRRRSGGRPKPIVSSESDEVPDKEIMPSTSKPIGISDDDDDDSDQRVSHKDVKASFTAPAPRRRSVGRPKPIVSSESDEVPDKEIMPSTSKPIGISDDDDDDDDSDQRVSHKDVKSSFTAPKKRIHHRSGKGTRKIKAKVKSLTQEHDIVIINHALRTQTISNLNSWSKLIRQNQDLFVNYYSYELEARCRQLIRGLCSQKFKRDHKIAIDRLKQLQK